MDTFRWDFGSFEQWPGDLRRMDLHSRRAVGAALMDILEEMKMRSLDVYYGDTFGGRSRATFYRGTWGGSLRIQTRGTGLTAGTAFGILMNVAPHAGDLAEGRRTGTLFDLQIWAEDKLGLDEDKARRVARALNARRTIQSPYPDIFTQALGPGSGFQEWADNHFARALDRVLEAGGQGV